MREMTCSGDSRMSISVRLLHEAGNVRSLIESRTDSASYDELWNALTPAERDKFLRALQDPDSELAKQLLASEVLEREQVAPWWEAPPELTSEDSDSTSTPQVSTRRHGTKPSIVPLPDPLIKRSSEASATGPLLLYNICAVW